MSPEGFSEADLLRIERTTAVRDTDPIPKVPDAGEVQVRDGRRVQVMHNGMIVEEGGYYGEWSTEVIRRLRGHHEPQEEIVFHAIVQRLREDSPGASMIELGSYWAYYSLWFRMTVPDSISVLVEPDPRHLEAGVKNFELNGQPRPIAIRGATGLAYQDSEELLQAAGPTPLLTVEEIMGRAGLDRLDLLHCDTQGGELNTLTEAEPLLRDGRIRFVVVSTHHHTTTGDPLTHQRCRELLERCGAHLIAEHSVSESCSADGLIAASMDPRDRDMHVPVSAVRTRDTLFGEVEYELAAAMRNPTLREQANAAYVSLRQRIKRA